MTATEIIRQTQTLWRLTSDGVAGPITDGRYAALKAASSSERQAKPSGGLVDARSERNIATLHPRLQPLARQFIKELVTHGIEAKIIGGTRTYAEQDELYAQGRTKPGRIVTNARAGYSNHNFGLAFDIGIFKGSAYLDESPLYRAASVFAKDLGLSWGGDWRNADEPHYELHPAWAEGLSESQIITGLRRRHDAGEDALA